MTASLLAAGGGARPSSLAASVGGNNGKRRNREQAVLTKGNTRRVTPTQDRTEALSIWPRHSGRNYFPLVVVRKHGFCAACKTSGARRQDRPEGHPARPCGSRRKRVQSAAHVSFLCAVAVCRTDCGRLFSSSALLRVKQKAPGSARRPGLSLRRRQRPIVWRPCRCGGGDREMFAAAPRPVRSPPCVCPLVERALIASRCHFSPGAHPRFDRRVSTYVPLSSVLFCAAAARENTSPVLCLFPRGLERCSATV